MVNSNTQSKIIGQFNFYIKGSVVSIIHK